VSTIPQGDAERKDAPMFRGLLGYFPWALFKVAYHSLRSDRKHNPGNPNAPTWAREKSTDHPDCIVRHLTEAWGPPAEGFEGTQLDWTEYHLTAIAWRANALLQEFGEAHRGATPGVSCKFPEPKANNLMHPAQVLATAAALNEEVHRLCNENKRIVAIKLVREQTGRSLKDAKYYVDTIHPQGRSFP
jgi:hypothetical protein